MRNIFCLLSILGLAGCASITQGTSQILSFKLEPKEAKCVLSRTGEGELGSIGATSNTIQVQKDKDDILIQCTAPGYQQKTARIVSAASTAGVTGVLLDFGITDMIMGAMYAYPTDVSIVMEKDILVAPTITVTQTAETKLKELKRLRNAGLISEEVYLAQQKSILSNP